MDKKKILVVEDEKAISDILVFNLQREGYDTLAAYDGAEGLRCALEEAPDLILLDVMMPGEDGFSVCCRIRTEVDCPILFLTARTEDAALVQGFGLGADDYIKKPFSLAELRVRVNAHIRRESRLPAHILKRGGVRFDMQAKTAFAQEHALPFTKGEYAICEYLALHAGQVFTKELLYEVVFGFDAEGNSSAIAEHIKNIRAKLKVCSLNPVETVWGVGYKWRKDNPV